MSREKLTTLLFLLMVNIFPMMAQDKGNITLSFNNESLPTALRQLEKASNYKIMFTYEDVQSYKVSGQVKDVWFEQALKMILSGKPLSYTVEGNLVTITKQRNARESRSREITG